MSGTKLLEVATAQICLFAGGTRDRTRRRFSMRGRRRASRPTLSFLCCERWRPQPADRFRGRILVADADPGHREDAVRLATAIADRASGDVPVVHAGRPEDPVDAAVACAVADLREEVGAPIEVVADGWPPHVIVEYAQGERASLVITGSRGEQALGRLRSVSTRVVHEAPCSVLVVPTVQPDDRAIPYA